MPRWRNRWCTGYRSNSSLGPVTLDPELMRHRRAAQARLMAAKGKLDHDVGAPFQERIRKSGFDAAVAVENIGAGYHTLAEAFSGWRDLAATPRQYAQRQRHPHGYRRGLYAEIEIQGVLVADPRRAG